jgi:hypothetical protein
MEMDEKTRKYGGRQTDREREREREKEGKENFLGPVMKTLA